METIARLFFNPLSLISSILAAVLLSTGCVSINRVSINDPINQETVAFIREGVTTFRDVVDELGAPSRLEGLKGGGVIAVYQFLDIRYSRVNYGWLLKLVPQAQSQDVDIVLAGGGLGIDTFEVAFDEGWLARYYAFTKHPDASHYVFWPFSK